MMIGKSFDPDTDIPSTAPNCLVCKHFKITWEAAFPRACVLFGLKCKTMPSTEVFLATGKHCFSFQPKVSNA